MMFDPTLDPDMFVMIGGKLHGSWTWHPRSNRAEEEVPGAFVHALGIDPASERRSFWLNGPVDVRFSSDGRVWADGLRERLGTDGRVRLVVTGERSVLVQSLPPIDGSSPTAVVSTYLNVVPGVLPPVLLVAAAMGFGGSAPSVAALLAATRGRVEPFRRAVHELLAGRC